MNRVRRERHTWEWIDLVPVAVVLVGERILTPVVQLTLWVDGVLRPGCIGPPGGREQFGLEPDRARFGQLPGRRVVGDEDRHRLGDEVRRQFPGSRRG
jgi:hypothetical protein